ncbi:MAG: MFS transporter [Candidatus Helarchaeota archaeon]
MTYYREIASSFYCNIIFGLPMGLMLAMISPYLASLFVSSFGGNINYDGWIFVFLITGFHVLMKGVASPATGYLADLKGRKLTLVLGCSLSILAAFCFFLTNFAGIALAIAGFLVFGLHRGFMMTSFNILAGDIAEKYHKVGQAESYCDALYIVGILIGGVISLVLKNIIPIMVETIIFLISFVLGIVGTLIAHFKIPETLPTDESYKADVSYKDLILQRNLIPTLGFAYSVESIETGFIATTLPLMLPLLLIPADSEDIFVTIASILGLMLFFIVAGYISDKKGRKVSALIGSFLVTIFAFMMLFTFGTLMTFAISAPLAIFLLVFATAGSSSFMRSSVESVWTDLTPKNKRGFTYGIFRFLNEIGSFATPFIIIPFLIFGVPLLFVLIIVIVFAITAFVLGLTIFKETLPPLE